MSVPLIGVPTRDDGINIPGIAGAVLLDQLPQSQLEKMASVTELHPKTEAADTQPIPVTRPESEEHQDDQGDEEHLDVVGAESDVVSAPELESEELESPRAVVPPPRAEVAPPVVPPKPPEVTPLVAPPRPVTDTKVDEVLIKAFSLVYVLSIGIGLVGQVIGFISVMGLWPAVIAGGAFELIMVTASTIGFSRIRNDHGWVESSFFLSVSAFCAAVAAYMNFHHWEGLQSTFFGFLTVVGFSLHVISHLWTSVRTRKALRSWKSEVAAVEAEKKRREEAERQAYDDWVAEQERQRRHAEKAAERAVQAASQRPAVSAQRGRKPASAKSASTGRSSAKAAKKATKTYSDTDLPGLVGLVLAAEDKAGQRFGVRRIQPMFKDLTQAQARDLAALVREQRP